MEDYKKLLREERSKDEPNEELLNYYKYKCGILPVQVIETNIYFKRYDKKEYKTTTHVQEIQCNSFEEYKENLNKPDITENHYIFD